MARKSRINPPKYTLHRSSGQARVRIDGKDHYLGPYGSAESHEKYHRLIAEWSASPPTLATGASKPSTGSMTVADLLLQYLHYAEGHYRTSDGRPGKEFVCMRDAGRPLHDLYGSLPVREFGPLRIKALQEHMINEKGWARTHINRSINRIRRVFKWGVSNELVDAKILQALSSVPGLKKGRTEARETEPVKPVPLERVTPVLDQVSRQVAAMIQIQLMCGCRPGEIVMMRECDIDKSLDVWIYTPKQHKTAWREHERRIFLGQKAQNVIKEFSTGDPNAYLFRPCDAVEVSGGA